MPELLELNSLGGDSFRERSSIPGGKKDREREMPLLCERIKEICTGGNVVKFSKKMLLLEKSDPPTKYPSFSIHTLTKQYPKRTTINAINMKPSPYINSSIRSLTSEILTSRSCERPVKSPDQLPAVTCSGRPLFSYDGFSLVHVSLIMNF
ncbi:hypothetical protein CEXT_328631 [Caerostris extrusa]|uniref:Uncharacterized protein n=1 Tax=Caerostris extrusa TaxID=172846 RepID=A0AAV4S3P6_CAEEX|nr:hypothetical protein CEXT_328631 [Caerostris extrusa]